MVKSYFKEQKNGYDKEQVDNYIRKLIRAYQKVYGEYLDIYEKQNAFPNLEKSKTQSLESV